MALAPELQAVMEQHAIAVDGASRRCAADQAALRAEIQRLGMAQQAAEQRAAASAQREREMAARVGEAAREAERADAMRGTDCVRMVEEARSAMAAQLKGESDRARAQHTQHESTVRALRAQVGASEQRARDAEAALARARAEFNAQIGAASTACEQRAAKQVAEATAACTVDVHRLTQSAAARERSFVGLQTERGEFQARLEAAVEAEAAARQRLQNVEAATAVAREAWQAEITKSQADRAHLAAERDAAVLAKKQAVEEARATVAAVQSQCAAATAAAQKADAAHAAHVARVTAAESETKEARDAHARALHESGAALKAAAVKHAAEAAAARKDLGAAREHAVRAATDLVEMRRRAAAAAAHEKRRDEERTAAHHAAHGALLREHASCGDEVRDLRAKVHALREAEKKLTGEMREERAKAAGAVKEAEEAKDTLARVSELHRDAVARASEAHRTAVVKVQRDAEAKLHKAEARFRHHGESLKREFDEKLRVAIDRAEAAERRKDDPERRARESHAAAVKAAHQRDELERELEHVRSVLEERDEAQRKLMREHRDAQASATDGCAARVQKLQEDMDARLRAERKALGEARDEAVTQLARVREKAEEDTRRAAREHERVKGAHDTAIAHLRTALEASRAALAGAQAEAKASEERAVTERGVADKIRRRAAGLQEEVRLLRETGVASPGEAVVVTRESMARALRTQASAHDEERARATSAARAAEETLRQEGERAAALERELQDARATLESVTTQRDADAARLVAMSTGHQAMEKAAAHAEQRAAELERGASECATHARVLEAEKRRAQQTLRAMRTRLGDLHTRASETEATLETVARREEAAHAAATRAADTVKAAAASDGSAGTYGDEEAAAEKERHAEQLAAALTDVDQLTRAGAMLRGDADTAHTALAQMKHIKTGLEGRIRALADTAAELQERERQCSSGARDLKAQLADGREKLQQRKRSLDDAHAELDRRGGELAELRAAFSAAEVDALSSEAVTRNHVSRLLGTNAGVHAAEEELQEARDLLRHVDAALCDDGHCASSAAGGGSGSGGDLLSRVRELSRVGRAVEARVRNAAREMKFHDEAVRAATATEGNRGGVAAVLREAAGAASAASAAATVKSEARGVEAQLADMDVADSSLAVSEPLTVERAEAAAYADTDHQRLDDAEAAQVGKLRAAGAEHTSAVQTTADEAVRAAEASVYAARRESDEKLRNLDEANAAALAQMADRHANERRDALRRSAPLSRDSTAGEYGGDGGAAGEYGGDGGAAGEYGGDGGAAGEYGGDGGVAGGDDALDARHARESEAQRAAARDERARLEKAGAAEVRAAENKVAVVKSAGARRVDAAARAAHAKVRVVKSGFDEARAALRKRVQHHRETGSLERRAERHTRRVSAEDAAKHARLDAAKFAEEADVARKHAAYLKSLAADSGVAAATAAADRDAARAAHAAVVRELDGTYAAIASVLPPIAGDGDSSDSDSSPGADSGDVGRQLRRVVARAVTAAEARVALRKDALERLHAMVRDRRAAQAELQRARKAFDDAGAAFNVRVGGLEVQAEKLRHSIEVHARALHKSSDDAATSLRDVEHELEGLTRQLPAMRSDVATADTQSKQMVRDVSAAVSSSYEVLRGLTLL